MKTNTSTNLIRARIEDNKIFSKSSFERDVLSIDDGFKVQKKLSLLHLFFAPLPPLQCSNNSRVLGSVKGYKVGPAKVADFSKWGLKHPGSGPVFTVLKYASAPERIFRTPQVIEVEIGMIIGAELFPETHRIQRKKSMITSKVCVYI